VAGRRSWHEFWSPQAAEGVPGCVGVEGGTLIVAPVCQGSAHYKDTSAEPRCKVASYEAKGATCKGDRPCKDTLEVSYEAISYCNALEKCVKLPVRGGKGVIVVREVF
jgi:hypothetical protein